MTDFTRDNFPIIAYIEEHAIDGFRTEFFVGEFEAAATGGDDERYGFALMLQQLANDPDLPVFLPGLPETIRQDSIDQATEIFRELMDFGHPHAKTMYDYMIALNNSSPSGPGLS